MLYSIGDKVKLVENGVKCLPEMTKYLGKCVTIAEVINEHSFSIKEDSGEYIWKISFIEEPIEFVNPDSVNKYLKIFYSDFIPKDILDFVSVMNLEYLNKKYDKCVGRTSEIHRICEVLLRKNKSNPILTGAAGSGKTAIVEEIVSMITDLKINTFDKKNNKTSINHPLVNKIFLNINLTNIMAGARYRGDFEERLKKVITLAINNPDIICFIDEIHLITGLNSNNGEPSMGQLLKSSLSRGEISVIGATTSDEYELIKKDKALDRRFHQIAINTFNKKQMEEIAPIICKTYSHYHNVKIPKDVITTALDLCDEFLDKSKAYPDKFIDVIDETSARIKLWKYNKKLTMTKDDICKTISNITGKLIIV